MRVHLVPPGAGLQEVLSLDHTLAVDGLTCLGFKPGNTEPQNIKLVSPTGIAPPGFSNTRRGAASSGRRLEKMTAPL
jgi:hypothetical protein